VAARTLARTNPTSQARLQLILVLLAAWNLLTFFLELTNGRFLQVNDIDGVLGVRAVGGSTAVLALAYLLAVRNPVRYRFVLWLASIEQVLTLFVATFHWARGDVAAGETLLPLLVAVAFLVALIPNLPRQTDTIGV
jgi:hypothetical protein